MEQIALLAALGGSLEPWAHQCHAASIRLVKSGVFDPSLKARVARGTCRGVGGQHSWVVLGGNCYDPDATVVDPTLWSYDVLIEGIHIARGDTRYRPHGSGSIYEWGKPTSSGGEPIILDIQDPGARAFLRMLGPLDRLGWAQLANAPVQGWPAKPIIEAMARDPRVSALVPVDIVGMVTDLNPSGLYLKGEKE